MQATRAPRYNAAAVTLHWVMAAAFFLMLLSGTVMRYATLERSDRFSLYQWHKSLGVLVLIAVLLRVIVRGLSRVPPWPARFSAGEARRATLGHMALYGVMIALPLSGWVMVSASVYGLPTIVFGWFEWPHWPGLLGNLLREHQAKTAHFWLALSFALLIAGHIGAVFWHYGRHKENLLPRMWYGRRA